METGIVPVEASEVAQVVLGPETGLVAVRSGGSDRHPAAVYLAGLAPGSRRSMRQALDVVAGVLTGGRLDAESLEWAAVRYQHVAAVRSHLAERYSAASVNKILCAVRGVLRECFRLGLLDAAEYQRAREVPSVRGVAVPAGRALSTRELQRLFQECAKDAGPAGARDAALLAVLYGAGLRRSEAVALEVTDYAPDSGALTVRSGKGNKARIAYASGGTRRALAAWLKVRGSGAGPLFVPISRAGGVDLRRMTDQALYKILLKRAAGSGVSRFSPHDLRRTFVGDLLDAGADISAVQQLAGHASVTTTARYDRRGERAKQAAAELLAVPFVEAGGA